MSASTLWWNFWSREMFWSERLSDWSIEWVERLCSGLFDCLIKLMIVGFATRCTLRVCNMLRQNGPLLLSISFNQVKSCYLCLLSPLLPAKTGSTKTWHCSQCSTSTARATSSSTKTAAKAAQQRQRWRNWQRREEPQGSEGRLEWLEWLEKGQKWLEKGRRGRTGQRGRRGRRGQKRAKTVDTVEKESALRPKLAEAVPSGMCGMRNLRNLHLRKGRAKATKKTGSMGMGKESENSEDLFHATNVAGSTTSVTAPKMQRVKASTMGMLHPYTRTKSSWILKIRIPPSGSMDAWLARMARMSNTFEKSRAPQLTLPDKVQVKARQMNSYMCCCRVKMLRLWTRLSGSQMISLIPCLINMLHFKLKKVILWKVLASKREQIGRHATIVENEGTWRSDARNQNIKTTLRNRMQRERKDIEGLNGLLFFASEFAQDGALRFQLYDQHDQLQDDRVQKLLAAAELVRRDVGTLLERQTPEPGNNLKQTCKQNKYHDKKWKTMKDIFFGTLAG